jgi:nickel-dependent lactate racemase
VEELTRLQTATFSGAVARTRAMTETETRALLAEALGAADLSGQRILVIIPDSTRTAPMALMSTILGEILEAKVEALDYLVALGTHPAMDDAALSRLLGREVINGRAGGSRVFNHRWEDRETFVTLGTITASRSPRQPAADSK